MTTQGQCLCKKVTIHAAKVSDEVGACHCSMCRKWSGGIYMATDCGTDVSFEGEQYISVFDSSDWAERGFCNHCGSHLFYRLKETQQYMMPASLFDAHDKQFFDHQFFIDEKPNYYAFANDTKNYTGEEVFELFAPKDD